jgi:hypothetical protein
MVPFVFGFGGVGVGALWMMSRILSGKEGAKKQGRKAKAATTGTGTSGAAGLWLFAFFWNVISFPIAFLAVPQILASREWVGLLVLLFPLVGIFLLWAAILVTFQGMKRGKPSYELASGAPRVGAAIEGNVRFPKGEPGEKFEVRLACQRTDRRSGETTASIFWSKAQDVKAVSSAPGTRLPFRFTVPANIPPTGKDGEWISYDWRLDVKPQGSTLPISMALEVGAAEAAPQVPADEPEPIPANIVAAMRAFPGFDASRLSPQQRSALAQMSPGQRQAIADVVKHGPLIKKVVIWGIGLFVLVQVLGAVVAIVISMNS